MADRTSESYGFSITPAEIPGAGSSRSKATKANTALVSSGLVSLFLFFSLSVIPLALSTLGLQLAAAIVTVALYVLVLWSFSLLLLRFLSAVRLASAEPRED